MLLLAVSATVAASLAPAARQEASLRASALSAGFAALLGSLHTGLDVLDELGVAGTSKQSEWSRGVYHLEGCTWTWWVQEVRVGIGLKARSKSVSHVCRMKEKKRLGGGSTRR